MAELGEEVEIERGIAASLPSDGRNRRTLPPPWVEAKDRFPRAPCQGGAFQWVQAPPGDSLPPEATGAGMEETKCLKPSDSGHEIR